MDYRIYQDQLMGRIHTQLMAGRFMQIEKLGWQNGGEFLFTRPITSSLAIKIVVSFGGNGFFRSLEISYIVACRGRPVTETR